MTRRSHRWVNALFLAPVLIAFIMVMVIPFFLGIYYSMTDFNGVKSELTFVGLKNYQFMFQDPLFLHSFMVTVEYTVINVILVNVVAFALSLMVTGNLKGRNFLRAGFFVPNLIGGIVLGYIWQILINCVLSIWGQQLLALNTTAGYWGLVILTLWQQVGYMMIIYIAGFQAVSEDMLEAAHIDGATRWQSLWHITIPNMMPSITICTFLTLTNSFKLFDQNLALTEGRPFNQLPDGSVVRTTEMLALNIVNSFSANVTNRGVGQAKAVLFCILVVGIGLFQLRATRSKEVQQ